MKIEGLSKLVSKLQKMAAKAKGENASVIVGYTAAYALYVHEAVGEKLRGLPRSPEVDKKGNPKPARGYYWDPQGRAQSKFLEEPARTLQPELAQIVQKALMQGKTLSQALLLAGLRLQRESQLRCPVDTGNLKASAFTRLENGNAA